MQGKVSWKEKERESGKKAGPLNLENLQEVGMVTLWHAAEAEEEIQICHQQAQPKTHRVEAGPMFVVPVLGRLGQEAAVGLGPACLKKSTEKKTEFKVKNPR